MIYWARLQERLKNSVQGKKIFSKKLLGKDLKILENLHKILTICKKIQNFFSKI